MLADSLIAFVASCCYVATWQVIYFKLEPEFGTKFNAMAIEKARSSGGTPAEIEEEVARMERFAELYGNPAVNAAITFIEPLPIGLLFALITAVVMSRQRSVPSPDMAASGWRPGAGPTPGVRGIPE